MKEAGYKAIVISFVLGVSFNGLVFQHQGSLLSRLSRQSSASLTTQGSAFSRADVSMTGDSDAEGLGRKLLAPKCSLPVCGADIPLVEYPGIDALAEKQKVFNYIKQDEMTAITAKLLSMTAASWRAINMTVFGSSFTMTKPKEVVYEDKTLTHKLTVNYVTTLQPVHPPKAAVLAYLDHDGPLPLRAARVTIIAGGAPGGGKIIDVVVSDLNAPPETWTVALHSTHAFNARLIEGYEEEAINLFLQKEMGKIEDILKADFNGAHYSLGSQKNIYWSYSYPIELNRNQQFFFLQDDVDGFWLNPYPLEITVQHGGIDPTTWAVTEFMYYGQFFPNIEAFKTAYMANQVVKWNSSAPGYAEFMKPGTEKPWSGMKRRPGPIRRNSDIPHSLMTDVETKRYSVMGNTVAWLGWEIHYDMDPYRGPIFKDIRFMGTRIAYEIALKDILVAYTGTGLTNSRCFYTDAYFRVGDYAFELIKGADCPASATYMDLPQYNYAKDAGKTKHNAVCIFEQEPGDGMNRHFESDYVGGVEFAAGTPDSRLVIRSAMAVGNYDYICDLRARPDGSIEFRCSASGYMQTEHVNMNLYEEQMKTGAVASAYSIGSIHTHIFSIKIDIELTEMAGTPAATDNINHLVIHEAKAGHWEEFSSVPRPSYIPDYPMMYVAMSMPMTELGMTLPSTQPKCIRFETDRNNALGQKKSYKLHFSGMPFNILQDHPYVQPGGLASWSRHQLAISKHKDGENWAVGELDLGQVTAPEFTFEQVLDGESIENEDIVAWATAGFIHLPIAEDVPVVNQHWSGVELSPGNFFTESMTYDLGEVVYNRGSSDAGWVGPWDGSGAKKKTYQESAPGAFVNGQCKTRFAKSSGFEGATD